MNKKQYYYNINNRNKRNRTEPVVEPVESWDYEYNANELLLESTPPWEIYPTSEEFGTEIIQDGKLIYTMDSLSSAGYLLDRPLDPEEGFTIETRLDAENVGDGYLEIGAFTNNGAIFLDVYAGSIEMYGYDADEVVEFDTSGMHTYRLMKVGDSLKLWADDSLVLDLTDVISPTPSDPVALSIFANGVDNTGCTIDYIKARYL